MDLVSQLLDIFLHINQHLTVLVENYGALVYGIIALIIFCEVGLVVAPFLPGDSMLFAIGALCATGAMDLMTVLTLFPVAAIAGDNFNRVMGITFGHRAFRGKDGRFFNQKNLDRAQSFFGKYGTRAITLCRFIPFFRTFVPFVAGMAGMRWRTFFPYSVLGGSGWVAVCVIAGYYFGNLEFIKGHFELVLLTVITVSALPAFAEYLKGRFRGKKCLPASGMLNSFQEQPSPESTISSPARCINSNTYRKILERGFSIKTRLSGTGCRLCKRSRRGQPEEVPALRGAHQAGGAQQFIPAGNGRPRPFRQCRRVAAAQGR